jgi:hypothetical protein
MDGILFISEGAYLMGSCIDQELAGCEFADVQIGKRFGMLMKQLSKGLGQPLPLACQCLMI